MRGAHDIWKPEGMETLEQGQAQVNFHLQSGVRRRANVLAISNLVVRSIDGGFGDHILDWERSRRSLKLMLDNPRFVFRLGLFLFLYCYLYYWLFSSRSVTRFLGFATVVIRLRRSTTLSSCDMGWNKAR